MREWMIDTALSTAEELDIIEKERQRLLTEKYAEVNKVVNNALVINDSIENITKIANSIGKVKFDNKIGDQSGIAVFNSRKELGDAYKIWLTKDNKNEDGTEKLTPAQIDSEVEQGMNSDGFKLPNGQMVINKSVAANLGAINVVNHEFLHKILDSTFRDKKQGALLVNQFLNVLSNKERAIIQKRIDNNYRYFKDDNGNIVEKNFEDYAEEYLNVFIDEIKYESIKDSDNIKQLLLRIASPILKYFRKLGFNKIEFESGEDVYQFLKSYQKNISKGRISERARKLISQEKVEGRVMFSKSIEEKMDKLDAQLSGNEIGIEQYEAEMKKLEQEDFEESKKTYEEEKKVVKKEPTKKEPTKKEPTEISEAATKAKAKLDAIGNDPKGFNPNNPTIYDELDKMVKVKSRNYKTSNGTIIDLTNKNKGGLDGFNMEEMTSYVTVSMLPYIQKFDPSKNDSLYGYINAQLANRMKAALKSGQVADVVFTEDVTEMTKLSNEDVEVKTPTLPERKKYQNILESGVFSPEVIVDVQAKILPIIRTLKSKVDEKTTLNRTTAPIINEIRTEIGKQADIDIKRAMGGKEDGQLRKFLLTNKKPVLENMTTTWLMGKDNGKTVSGGMPFAVQKRINGQWQSYPDWIGKKVDRESVETDLAGRTSGAELVRRLPNVVNNVTDDVFLDSIIDPVTGLPLRGRKEALAKAMSEELAFDLISDDMLSGGPIYQALQKNQEILGAEVGKVTVENISRLAERGNIKYSLSADLILDLENNSVALGKAIVNLTNFETVNIKSMLSNIFANDWNEDQINEVAASIKAILTRNYKFWEGAEPLEYEKNTGYYFANIGKEQDFGEDVWKRLGADISVARFYTETKNVEKLQELNKNFMVDLLLEEGDKVGTTMLNSMWAPTTINSGNIISLFRPDKGKSAKTMFNKALNQARKTAFGKNTNNIGEATLATNYSGFKKVNKVHDNILDETIILNFIFLISFID
jgi:hypothetical protein